MKHAIGNVSHKGKQVPAVVQAKTKKRMLELINTTDARTSMHYFNNYWLPGNHTTITENLPDEEGLWIGIGKHPMSYDYNNYTKVA